MEGTNEPPVWNEEFAASIVGATVLVGITRVHTDGPEQEQMFGTIQSLNDREGIAIALAGSRTGETYWLPPDLRNFVRAQPGVYRLRSTGETVDNPDYTSTWEIYPQPDEARRFGSDPISDRDVRQGWEAG